MIATAAKFMLKLPGPRDTESASFDLAAFGAIFLMISKEEGARCCDSYGF